MQTRHVVAAFAVAALVAAAGCNGSGDGEQTGDGLAVSFVAGGGGIDAGAEPVAAEDARIAGRVTDLTEGTDGGVWGIVEGAGLLSVIDGQVQVLTPTLPDGTSPALLDVAVSPVGTVYVAVSEPIAGGPAVYQLGEDGALEPGFGVAAGEAELAAAAPVSPDGTAADSAVLGPVVDIAAGADGEITFVEQVVPGGLQAVNLVRRIADHGIVTLAGGTPAPGVAPEPDEVQAASFPALGSEAVSMPVLGVVSIAVDGDVVYVQTLRSLLAIAADGTVTSLLGAEPAVPLPVLAGPFGESVPAAEVDFRGHLDTGPTAAGGDVLAVAIGGEVGADNVDPWRWVLDGGTSEAAEIAEASAGNAEPAWSVLVTGDDARVADVTGTASLLTADGDVVMAGWDFEREEAVIVRYPVDAD